MLILSFEEDDISIVWQMKSSLLKSFIPTNESDVEKGVELANYLVSQKKYVQAKDFLDSFIYLEPSKKPEELWVTNAQELFC